MSSIEICLLDDDPAVLKGLDRLLSSANLSTRKFTDPQEFLNYCKTQRPVLAVIDLCMPAMNGLEVQSRLLETSPSTRVMILTGKQSKLARDSAFRAGAVGFFSKEFDTDEFLAAIHRALKA